MDDHVADHVFMDACALFAASLRKVVMQLRLCEDIFNLGPRPGYPH